MSERQQSFMAIILVAIVILISVACSPKPNVIQMDSQSGMYGTNPGYVAH